MLSGQDTENTVILVMDREDEDVRLITQLLEKSGFAVILSSDKADLLSLCRTANNSVQLVIIDAETRGLQMSELLNEVQAIDPRIRILLMSKKEGEPVRHWSSGNVRGQLSRPFRRAQFLGSVLEAAKGPLVRTA